MSRRRLVVPAASLLVLIAALVMPAFAPHDPAVPVTAPFAPPGPQAVLGGDELGRDVLSRFMTGGALLTATCLVLAVAVTVLAAFAGVVAAVRRRLGALIAIVCNVFILLPPLLGMLVLLVAFPDLGLVGFGVVALLFGVPYSVPVFAAAADGIRRSGYVEVAVNNGESTWGLVWREIVPSLWRTFFEQLGIRFVASVHMVSTAAFLGLTGALGDGNWASSARASVGAGMALNPWSAVAPVCGIAAVTVAVRSAVTLRPGGGFSGGATRPDCSAGPASPGAGPGGVRVSGLLLTTPDGVERRYALDARPGTVTLLTGPSGSGKTLLLEALVGHVEPGVSATDDGMTVAGAHPLALRGRRLRAFRRSRVTLVGQDAGLALPGTVRVGHLLRAPVAAGAAVRLGVPAAALSRRAGELSGGERRRVAVARALGRGTPVLLLDEPFAGLDRARADALVAVLRERAAAGATVVVSGHDVEYLAPQVDAVVDVTGGAPASRMAVGAAVPPIGEPVLTARGITVSRGDRTLLSGVDLVVPAGVLTALGGESGAGKSTLARALAGIAHGEVTGSLTLDGAPLPLTGRSPAARRAVQLIPQDSLASLHPRRTIAASIQRVAALAGDHRDRVELAADLLGRVGLDPALGARRPHELSGGQRQRAAVARALAARPRVLICDEVTSALDYGAAERILTLLTEVAADDAVGVLVIGHDEESAARFCAQRWVVDAGVVRPFEPEPAAAAGSRNSARARP